MPGIDVSAFKNILSEARAYFTRSGDIKYYVTCRKQFDLLIDAGAKVLSNGQQASGMYCCKVLYNEIIFFHASSVPIVTSR